MRERPYAVAWVLDSADETQMAAAILFDVAPPFATVAFRRLERSRVHVHEDDGVWFGQQPVTGEPPPRPTVVAAARERGPLETWLEGMKDALLHEGWMERSEAS